MSRTVFRYFVLTILIFVLVGITACGGSEAPPPEPVELTGSELLQKMTDAVKATNTVVFTANFQIATPEGGVKGTLKFWGERPDNMRAEVTSEDPDLDGLVAVTNADKGWAYIAGENFVLVADKSQYKAQLNQEPEVREILDSGERIIDRGFDDTANAQNLGTEDVGGNAAYKVEVKYDKASNPELELEGVTTTYFIDQESFLPRRIEISIEGEDASASGFVAITDFTTGESIEANKFTFEPPADATVMDLNEIVQPDFSSQMNQ